MNEIENTPSFVSCDGMITDKEYLTWLSELKRRFQSSQAKAAVRVNTAMLEYYWSLGRDIVKKKAESKWGSGFFNQLSADMRSMFPNETGFSSANLRYMKRWYQFYYEQIINLHQPGEQLYASNLHQPGDELRMPAIFGKVPWKHHVETHKRDCPSCDRCLGMTAAMTQVPVPTATLPTATPTATIWWSGRYPRGD